MGGERGGGGVDMIEDDGSGGVNRERQLGKVLFFFW